MGAGISQEIVPGLYVSGMGVARDRELLRNYGITHIVSLMPDSRSLFDDIEYLLVPAEDAPTFAIHQHFRNCNSFIHTARKNGGKVLVHCMAGKSRSVTVCVAYVMSCTSLTWKEALDAVRAAHAHADPNFGFRAQLRRYFEEDHVSASGVGNINSIVEAVAAEQQKRHRRQLIVGEREFLTSISADLYEADEKCARAWHAKQAAFVLNGHSNVAGGSSSSSRVSPLISVSRNVKPEALTLPRIDADDFGERNQSRGHDNVHDNGNDLEEYRDSVDELHVISTPTPDSGPRTKRIACGRQRHRLPSQQSSLSTMSLVSTASPPNGDYPATPQPITSPRLPSTPVCFSLARNSSSSALPSALNRANVHVSRVDAGESDVCDNGVANGSKSSNNFDQRSPTSLRTPTTAGAAPSRMVIDLQEYFTKAMQDKLEAERQQNDAKSGLKIDGEHQEVTLARQRLSFSPTSDIRMSIDDENSSAPSLTTTPKSIFEHSSNNNPDDDVDNLRSESENALTESPVFGQSRHASGGDDEMFQLDAV